MSPVSGCGVSPAAAQCTLCLGGAASAAWLLLPINTPPHRRRQPGHRRHGRRGAPAQAPGQLARGQLPGHPSSGGPVSSVRTGSGLGRGPQFWHQSTSLDFDIRNIFGEKH